MSSEFSAALAAANAFDGDPATDWSSRGDGDDAYGVIDMGGLVDITAVAFETRPMGDGTATAETFTITVGDETFGPLAAGLVPDSVTGQVIRFDVATSTGGNAGASEIRVFSDS